MELRELLGEPDEGEAKVECVSGKSLVREMPEDGGTAVVDEWDLLVFGDIVLGTCVGVVVDEDMDVCLSPDDGLVVVTTGVEVSGAGEPPKQLSLGPCPTMKGLVCALTPVPDPVSVTTAISLVPAATFAVHAIESPERPLNS